MENKECMLLYAYLMYCHEIHDGWKLYVENIIVHDLVMLHVALIIHVVK